MNPMALMLRDVGNMLCAWTLPAGKASDPSVLSAHMNTGTRR